MPFVFRLKIDCKGLTEMGFFEFDLFPIKCVLANDCNIYIGCTGRYQNRNFDLVFLVFWLIPMDQQYSVFYVCKKIYKMCEMFVLMCHCT